MNIVRTHTYWMNFKEYKKYNKQKYIHKKYSDNIATRTHIIFR